MKTLIILGSPRKNGNSETIARTIAGVLEQQQKADTEYVRLTPLKIAPCIGCGGCEATGECVVMDTMQGLYPKIDQADIILLVSPIYFYGLSAQAKAYVDRTQARWSRKYLLNIRFRHEAQRQGYLICTAATQGKKLFDGATLTAKSHFDAIDVPYGGELLIRGVDAKDALAAQPEEIERAKTFARKIVDDFHR